jgi:phosphate transport system substrate-binding protein
MNRQLVLFLCSLCVLWGSGCAKSTRVVIKIDGSSTVFPVTQAVAEEFQETTRARVTVGVSGTGGGFKKFVRGEIDIANASRPILTEEIALAKEKGIEFIELPVCIDALSVVVNKDNNWCDYLTVEELKKMWNIAADPKKPITHWSEIRSHWPNAPFSLYGPGTDSGTFDYFTEAINGKAKQSRSDYNRSEDDNVLVNGIAGDRYALGYFGYSFYAFNRDKLKAVPVQWSVNKVKEPVAPSEESILAGTYNPLSRPLFIYVNKESLQKEAVVAFVEFYLDHVAELAKEEKYVPLPTKAQEACRERLRQRKTGTVFGGIPEVGVMVDELIMRELR